ncbi:hypothetical protein LTS17_007989 [Exophiala oligosperma]
MARVNGLIKSSDIRGINPIFAPPTRIGDDVPHHKGVDGIVIKYRSKAERIREVVPDIFTLEEEPVVTLMAVRYEASGIGPYHELILTTEVGWNGKTYDFNILLLVDNEDSIYSGREYFGFPKVHASFDFNLRPDGRTGFMHVRVRRPEAVPVVEILFKPVREIPDPWAAMEGNNMLNIRVLPSGCGFNGGKPVVRQVVDLGMKVERGTSGEVWQGVGSITYPINSEFDPFYKFPVVEYLSSVLLRNVDARMDPLPKFHDF